MTQINFTSNFANKVYLEAVKESMTDQEPVEIRITPSRNAKRCQKFVNNADQILRVNLRRKGSYQRSSNKKKYC